MRVGHRRFLMVQRSSRYGQFVRVGAFRKVTASVAHNAKDSAEMPNSAASLSTRERTIVLLMGHGLTNKMIARQLSIAPETVKSHAKSIFWKLTVQSRAQAVYRASTLGLL
jgi:DNA-binding NarL/FixJ family response regulator